MVVRAPFAGRSRQGAGRRTGKPGLLRSLRASVRASSFSACAAARVSARALAQGMRACTCAPLAAERARGGQALRTPAYRFWLPRRIALFPGAMRSPPSPRAAALAPVSARATARRVHVFARSHHQF